ncbi:hypothetical protein E4T56_gene2505 [Termitomyces sp. T112]|nr:hypothetical protein E4T56_gene2505 [Termitomyces sp. T112]KAH0590895.1 hypothetical protein H2248_001010 [Termitomyces sp. 'cryptogamus']
MDNEHISTAQENSFVAAQEDHANQVLENVLYAPLRLFLVLTTNLVSYLRPFAAQIIPVLICIFLIPLILLLSFFSGLIVWKSVAVGWESPLHLQFGDGSPPYALSTLPPLVPQQRYDVSVHLSIPAVESNYALGNFMTTLTLSTTSNNTLSSVRRPAIVFPPRTSFFRRKPSTISVTVPMVSSFLPGSSTIIAFVEVGRGDQWKSLGNGEGREISVISASVKGSVVHHGIRGLVSRFPLTFALISATLFLVILSVILAGCILPTMFRRAPRDESSPDTRGIPTDIGIKTPSSSSSDIDEKSFVRRRGKQSRSLSRKSRIKVEAMPAASIKSNALRRRASRTLDGRSDSDS